VCDGHHRQRSEPASQKPIIPTRHLSIVPPTPDWMIAVIPRAKQGSGFFDARAKAN